MTSLIKEEFEDRQSDIDRFFELVDLIESSDYILSENNHGELLELPISDQLKSIMRSVILLINYNQVEATMRGCLESVYDHIEDNNIGYDQLNNDFQKSILKNTLKYYNSDSNLHQKLNNDLNTRIPRASLFIKKIFNGNISKETIHSIEKSYQINITAPSEARAGSDLSDLKNARNDLAHGNVSFSKHGRDITHSDILEQTKRARMFLEGTINSFENYILDKKYLRIQS